MAGKSSYLEGKFLGHVLSGVPYAAPATVYAGLYTGAPTDAGGGTEVTGAGYVRKAVAFDAAVAGIIANSGIVEFDQAASNWGLVTHFGLFDTETSGNLMYWGPLTAPHEVILGTILTFAAGALVVTED